MAEEKPGIEEAEPGANEFEEFLSEVSNSRNGIESEPELDTQADLTPEPAAEPEPETEPVVEPDPEPEPEPVSTPKMYKVPDEKLYGELRGSQATAVQLEEAGLLDKLIGRDHQELHHVKLYQELQEEFKAFKEQQQQQQQAVQQAAAAPPPRSVQETASEIESHYTPGLKQLAEQGAFEEDFLTVYPKAASQLEHRFQTGGLALTGTIRQVTELTNRLSEVMEYIGMQQQGQQMTVAQQNMESKLDAVAQSVPVLSDRGVRDRFIEWVIDDNNPITANFAEKDIETIQDKEIKAAFAAYASMTGDGVKRRQAKPVAGSQPRGPG